MKTLCAFGNFDTDGARSWVIRTGLEAAGFEIRLCRTDVRGFLPKIRDLSRQWKTCAQGTDALYLVFLGHYLAPLAWWLKRRKRIPLIFDAFISLYDTEVYDRKRISRWHPKAWLLWLIDWLSCRLADVVLIDTEEHKQYFVREFGVPPEKILVLPIGCRSDIFQPAKPHAPGDEWIVEFHGTFIPLQGIEVILRAAKLLENEPIRFELAGKGQTFPAMRSLAESLQLKNVRFLESLPMQRLPELIHNADVCLGIFGTTPKALRVVPTKAYEIVSCARPLITERSPAAERVFQNRENAILTAPGDPESLASAIRMLRSDPALAQNIGQNCGRLSLEKWNPQTIVTPLVLWLQKHLHDQESLHHRDRGFPRQPSR